MSEQRFFFFCVNEKLKGKCCEHFQATHAYEHARKVLQNLLSNLQNSSGKNAKVVKTSCLGKCAFGPNVYVAPDNIWYRYTNINDLDKIIQAHQIHDKPVPALINPAIECRLENVVREE